MNYPRSLLLSLFMAVAGPTVKQVSGATTCIAPDAGMTSVSVPTGEVLWKCPNPDTDLWNNANRVIRGRCDDPGQIQSGPTCAASSSPLATCSVDQKPALEGSTVTQHVDTEVAPYALYYQCTEPKAWLSGMKGRISQCINGQWTPVHDLCDDACHLPRDCSMVSQLGFNDSDIYSVIPSGDVADEPIKVHCLMSTELGDTGWTTVLNLFTNITEPPTGWDKLIGNDTMTTDGFYFIGYDALLALNRDKTDNGEAPRLLTLMIMIAVEGADDFVAVYDKVQLSDTLALEALDTYHGNAGDALSPSVGQDQDGTLWWNCPTGYDNCSLVTWGSIAWQPITSQGFTITGIKVFARPDTFDTGVACPPTLGYWPTWTPHTLTNMTGSRAEGAVVNYTCVTNYADGDGTSAGIATCTNTGNALAWDVIPKIPCQLNCPEGYTRSTDGKTCIMNSTTTLTNGVHEAAQKCHEQSGGSLMLVTDVAHLASLSADQFYYTGHIHKGGAFDPTQPSDLVCAPEEDCTASTTLACMGVRGPVNNEYHFRAQACNDTTTGYICEWPAKCPTDFKPYKGFCFHVASSYTPLNSFEAALTHCQSMGSVLAFPQTVDVKDYLITLIKMDPNYPSAEEIQTLLGINDKFGDFTADGMYSPDSEMTAVAGTSTEGKNYRVLNIPANADSSSVTLVPDTLVATATNIKYAICQLHGPTGCWTGLATAPANSYLTWDNNTALAATATYTCYAGYFVDGNTTMSSQEVKCMGQLGGWVRSDDPALPVTECIAADVCTGPPAAPSPNITNTTSANPLHLNATTNYTCPSNMGTVDMNTTQVLTCVSTGPSEYAFDPADVQACDVCLGQPTADNANTTWSNTTTYSVGNTVTATCVAGHEVQFGVNTQDIACTEAGWETKPPCYLACVDAPPTAGTSMTQGNHTQNTIGTKITYTCDNDLHVLLNGSTSLVNVTDVTCGSDGKWSATGTFPDCLVYCQEAVTVGNATTSSSSTTHYADGSVVTATCSEGYALGMTQTTQNVTCSSAGWSQATACYKACVGNPPTAGASMTAPSDTSNRIGTSLNYTCAAGTYVVLDTTKPAVTWSEVTCQDDGRWSRTEAFPDCGPASPTGPSVDNNTTLITGPDAPYAPGSVVTISCAPQMTSFTGHISTTATYNGTHWIPANPDFMCLLSTCTADTVHSRLQLHSATTHTLPRLPILPHSVPTTCN